MPTLTEETTAVESRLNEIENEMSLEHRDHAFEYWCKVSKIHGCKVTAKQAWDYCHSIYSREPRIIYVRPPICGLYGLFAIGVVCGLAISLLTFAFTIN